MKRILNLATAALLGASVIAAPALAQSGNATPGGALDQMGASDDGTKLKDKSAGGMDAGSEAGAQPLNPDIDTGTTAAIAPTFDSALTAIDGSATSAQSIGSLVQVDTVNVVSVGALDGHNPAALDNAVAQNEASVEELRAAIGANAALSEQLQAQSVEADAVVGAQIEADGAVTVYVM